MSQETPRAHIRKVQERHSKTVQRQWTPDNNRDRLKSVDHLDVNFNLTEESFKPFRKPNSQLLYVNKQSNHPKSVTKQIPNSVNKRLNTISSNSALFDEAKGEYERALENSGYTVTLSYTEDQDIRNSNRKKKQKKKNHMV